MSDLGQHDPAVAWSRVAKAWDDHVDYVDDHSREATAALLDRVGIRSGDRVLELAAGPGSLGDTLAGLVGADGSVVVSDVAPGMVDVARRRNAGVPNVSCAVLDASAIDVADGAFDVVLCRMGLMFTPDPAVAFGEIRRVLGEGGRLGVMTWGRLDENPWMTCVGIGAMLAGIATGGPPVGPGSIFSLGDANTLQGFADGAGFTDVRVEAMDVVFRAPDIDTHVTRVGSLAGPLAAVLQAATDEQQAALREQAANLAAPYAGAEGYAIPGRVLLLSARR